MVSRKIWKYYFSIFLTTLMFPKSSFSPSQQQKSNIGSSALQVNHFRLHTEEIHRKALSQTELFWYYFEYLWKWPKIRTKLQKYLTFHFSNFGSQKWAFWTIMPLSKLASYRAYPLQSRMFVYHSLSRLMVLIDTVLHRSIKETVSIVIDVLCRLQ